MKRREFITMVGTAALTVPVMGGVASCMTTSDKFEGHKFPGLKYDFNALEPYIDALTMEIHYTKHHKGYFNNFKTAAEGTELIDTPMEKIFESIGKYPVAVRNNGGGFYNHTLFWENMTPSRQQIPALLKEAIEKDFNSVESFLEQFGTAAKTHFGSGWAWLASDSNGKLFVTSTADQDNPLMAIPEITRGTPLLALDIWEHAYYLKYQNKRADYVDNFWNLVNWEVVNNRLLKARA